MRHLLFSFFTLLLLVCFVLPYKGFAQRHEYDPRIGLQINGGLIANEFGEANGYKGSYVARALGRFDLNDNFQLEIGAGYGSYAGLDFVGEYYRSELIPGDVRVLYNLLGDNSEWNPYLYAGVGALHYRLTTFPKSVSPNLAEDNGYTGYVPAGIGAEIPIADGVGLDLNIGVLYSFTDNLNFYKGETPTDALYTGGIGILFGLGGGNPDPDNDGLPNNDEKQLGTDPQNRDTDGDGLSDGDEVLKYHTDPLKKDTDGDKLTDYDELMVYHTDPLKKDTDGDGLSDGDEVMNYHTDPLNKDTDADGLSDGDEVLKYHTDPLKKDTDGGSVSDGVEIARGTDPLNQNDDVPKVEPPKEELKTEVGKAIVLEGIVFRTNSADITPVSENILEKAYNTLAQNPDIQVEVRGYTDNVGKRAHNMKLSQARANAVKEYLVKKGVAGDRITAKGFGPDNPIASNALDEGKQKNRRIEFFRVK